MLSRFSVSIPEQLVSKFDRLIAEKGYSNRSEALRDLMRKMLVEKEWEDSVKGGSKQVGVVVLVYDHETLDLSQKLTHQQHQSPDNTVAAVHVHLDKRNCLEVLVLKGDASQITEIANKLIATKGVKFGRFVRATTGQQL